VAGGRGQVKAGHGVMGALIALLAELVSGAIPSLITCFATAAKIRLELLLNMIKSA
jgi:hypothetical protein